MFLGIDGWDFLALGVYLAGITLIGIWSARRVKDTADFFIGGRRFGKAFMIFFAFGAGTNGNQAVGVASKTYSNGLSGIWYQWLWLFATPFYWIIAPVFRRMRALTTGDYFQYRYGGYTDALYTVVGVLQLTVNIGVMLLGSATVIEAISDGAIPKVWGASVMTVLFVAYGIAGGLSAAIITDFIQGILTVLLSFMILPFALSAVGGFTGLHASITDKAMFSLVAPGEINGFHILIFALNALIGIVTQPHIMGVCAAGKNEMDGRVGFAAGNLLKRFCTVAWMLTGLCAVVLYIDRPDLDPDLVYGEMARDLFPKIMPGLIGVFLASLLASVMSSCDAFMVSSAGLFTQNLYRRYFVRSRADKHYVFVGRVASLVIVAGSLAFAFTFEDVPSGLEMFWKIQAMMGAAFWVGLFWRRATPAGAWAGTLGAFAMLLLTSNVFFDFSAWAVAHLPPSMIWDGRFRVSYQMATYLSTGFSLCILVSLITPRVSEAKLDRFYACLRTPVQPDEPHAEPFTLPEGIDIPAPRRLLNLTAMPGSRYLPKCFIVTAVMALGVSASFLFAGGALVYGLATFVLAAVFLVLAGSVNNPDVEIPVPSIEGALGFLFFWACVAGMIAFVFWMAQWGT